MYSSAQRNVVDVVSDPAKKRSNDEYRRFWSLKLELGVALKNKKYIKMITDLNNT